MVTDTTNGSLLGAIGRALLRRLPLIGTLLGLVLGAWLVATHDLSNIGSAFSRVGWLGLLAVVLVRLHIVSLCGVAWARVLSGLVRVNLAVFVILRFVREGINVLLPVASVGGEVVGGRLLTFWGVGGALAAGSILADLLLQVVTLFLFTVIGVSLLTQLESESAVRFAGWMMPGLAVAGALLAAFFAVQRVGAVRLVERQLAEATRRFVTEARPGRRGAASVQDALDAIWARGRMGKLIQSLLLHLAAWMLGAAELWIALTCMGIQASLTEVLVLESLAQALKAAAFMVPSGLGVQEGGFVAIGALFGLDADTAIALSLVKRVPDVVLGLPSLIVWQSLEARRGVLVPERG